MSTDRTSAAAEDVHRLVQNLRERDDVRSDVALLRHELSQARAALERVAALTGTVVYVTDSVSELATRAVGAMERAVQAWEEMELAAIGDSTIRSGQ